jgi:NAD kinase
MAGPAGIAGVQRGTSVPRVVVVTRQTEYRALVAKQGTRGQAEFFLRERAQSIAALEDRDRAFDDALSAVLAAIPTEWRRARVDRADLDRFLFEPDDIVVAVGQDGLVANAAKYLDGQPVIGCNPDPSRYEGVLVRHAPDEARRLIVRVGAARGDVGVQERVMVEATLDDGQRITALNEVFVGHASHQSARYTLTAGGAAERQSSSGIVVTTGTGATGWGRSISLERHSGLAMPAPDEPALAFFVREAWPSVTSGATLTEGRLDAGASLAVTSEMNQGGTIFGDGIEEDRLEFAFGRRATVAVSPRRLRLVL